MYVSFPHFSCSRYLTHLFVSLACMPPPACRVKYLSCMVRMYHRSVEGSNSSWKVSWSEISSWFAVTSTPAQQGGKKDERHIQTCNSQIKGKRNNYIQYIESVQKVIDRFY